MVVGYCRTSKTSQELALQKDALEKYGVDHIYTEQMSGVKQRPVMSVSGLFFLCALSLVYWAVT